MAEEAINFPSGTPDERELLLRWLRYLRGAVQRKAGGITDAQARWTPEGALIPLLGIVRHLTCVEWRWIDGGMLGHEVSRSEDEFASGPELTIERALADYVDRAAATERAVLSFDSLDAPCSTEPGTDLRWVLLHLINETARHAGHADAVRQLLDGTTGE